MHTPPAPVPLDLTQILPPPLRPWSRQLEPVLYRLFVPEEVSSGLRHARSAGTGAQFVRSLLEYLDIRFQQEPADLARIPVTGPAVVVANHPFGIAEGLLLAVVLDRIRPDWKILTNSVLSGITEMREYLMPVNPFETAEAGVQNRVPLRRSIEWLKGGGILAIFPAGEVAHMDWKQHSVTDPRWKNTAARLALRAGCPVVPIFIEGANSLYFQAAGVLHPVLRTVSLVRELAGLSGKTLRFRVGTPVSGAIMRSCPDAASVTAYLRSRTLLLAHRSDPAPIRPIRLARLRMPQTIAAAQSKQHLVEEVAGLPAENELARQGDLSVYIAAAQQIPCLLQEIGRCREVTFREAGEGTGKPADLDSFDRYYQHLFLWDRPAGCLAGAYRLAVTTDVLPRFGVKGLYTSTLFHFQARFFQGLGPAFELGRSFVRKEYQKDFAPLLLLWKGITRMVLRRPGAPVLFGAVSISREYRAASRGLIAAFLSGRTLHPLAEFVAPRRRFRDPSLRDPQVRQLAAMAEGIEDLSPAIADIEQDGKGIPVLIRQYLKTGGRLLGLSVDPHFSHTLDALILADLRSAPPPLLERCMGRREAAQFLAKQSAAN